MVGLPVKVEPEDAPNSRPTELQILRGLFHAVLRIFLKETSDSFHVLRRPSGKPEFIPFAASSNAASGRKTINNPLKGVGKGHFAFVGDTEMSDEVTP